MRWFKALPVLLCSLATHTEAQNSSALLQAALTTLPKCAINCLVTSVKQSTCELTDFYCIAHDAQLNANMEACVQASCTVREALTTKNFTVTAYGLPVRDHSKLVSYSGMIGGGLTLLAVILRSFARMPCCGGTWGWDDWGILATMIPVLPLTALSVVLANDGLGKDLWTVPFDKITKILHIYYFDEMLYLSSIALTKISILLFYLRIFPNPTFRKLVWVGIAYCVGYILGTILALIFQCKPLNLAWTHWDNEHPGQCFNLNLLGWLTAALNIFGDLIVICLPLHELSKLAMGRRKKAGIMLMFLGGGFVTIVSMLRLKYMIQFANSHNVTWDYTPIGYWSTLEVHVGIIIACLPAVRSLQLRIFPSSRTQNSYYLGPAGAYGYNSKGGSPFPSSIAKSKGGHVDLMTAATQPAEYRSRDRTPGDKEFIQLEEYEFRLGDKSSSFEKEDACNPRGKTSTQIERGSVHTDDDAVFLPIQSTRGLSPPRAVYQNSGRNTSPQFITVTKDYSVTVEMTPEHLSSSPPRESEDMGRGRRESQVALTRFSGIEKSSSQKRFA
ncbi:hypothetical protein DPSP01_007456 [Paraphaeosphaeria sporulosa]|uniref:Uncharacterized protein n=1 Tax=Paraphaeosphaeria sporulosa TaxID=1460663 RepID=A0A177CXP8_9PLEO|nr:uncharacterized protein CC84DRAFT_1224949 [Paraphaeosphaeria sporulosa]OAG11672.1 hypothetical protein CC84DRAFT_1224949 [Paraphaeosphaeria sporulosa]